MTAAEESAIREAAAAVLQSANADIEPDEVILRRGGKTPRCPSKDGKPGNVDVSYRTRWNPKTHIWSIWLDTHRGNSFTTDLCDGDGKPLNMPLSNAEQIEQQKQDRQDAADRRRAMTENAKTAKKFQKSLPLPTADLEYWQSKHLLPEDLPCVRTLADGSTIVLFEDVDEIPRTYQRIPREPGGIKKFPYGDHPKGTFAHFPGKHPGEGPWMIGEGTATVAAAVAATGYEGAAAGDCGKLLDVALALRKRWPDREIAFVSDNDLHLVAKGKDNAGLVHAEAAAKAVGGAVALCPGEGDRGVDFADLYVEGRFDDIRDTVNRALEALRSRPEPSPGADVEPAEPSPAVVPADGGTRRKTGDIDPTKVTEAKKTKLLAKGYRLAGACSNRENVYVPDGFFIEDGRLLFRNDKNESVCFGFGPDAEEYEKLDDLGGALYMLGIGDDERGENLRVRVRWNDRDGKPREALIPLGLAGSRGGKLESLLLSLGYPMTEAGRKYIAGFFLAANPSGRFQIARRGGWHGNRFVLGNEVLGVAQPGDPELLPETTGGETVFKVMGDVESWRKNVLPFVVGNSRLIFALCVGFAAPLLRYFPTVDGGIVHFYGTTSTGKTSTCQLAASIYGNPATGAGGYVNTWNSTVNGLEGLASRFSDVLMVLDEIGEAKPAAISDAAYMIANGRGRNRAKGDGTIRDSAAWRVMVVSSGEIPFSQYLRMGKLSPMAGQEARFISLPVDAGKGLGALDVARNNDSNTHIEALKAVLVQNYGALGRAWISYLCKRLTPDYIESRRREVLPSFINTLLDGRKACGEVKRVAGRFALVALAGEMANECFSSEDSPFFKPSPFQYIRQCFDAWIAERGGMDSSADENVLKKVREFLTEYGERRFKVISDNPYAEIEPFRGDFLAGYRQNIGGVTAYFITADALVKHIAPEYGKPVIVGILSDAGWLRRDDGNHMTVRKMVDGKRRRFLQIIIPDDPE